MNFKHFFGTSCRESEPTPVLENRPTVLLFPEQGDDGSHLLVTKSLELELDPCLSLSFDDFTISNLLKAGIKPKHLKLNKDIRMGGIAEAEIQKFNEHLDEIADQLFND